MRPRRSVRRQAKRTGAPPLSTIIVDGCRLFSSSIHDHRTKLDLDVPFPRKNLDCRGFFFCFLSFFFFVWIETNAYHVHNTTLCDIPLNFRRTRGVTPTQRRHRPSIVCNGADLSPSPGLHFRGGVAMQHGPTGFRQRVLCARHV